MTWLEIIALVLAIITLIAGIVTYTIIIYDGIVSSDNIERDKTTHDTLKNHKENIETLITRVGTLEASMSEYKRKCEDLDYRLQKLEPTYTIKTIGPTEIKRASDDISVGNCYVKSGNEVIKDEVKELKEVIKNLATEIQVLTSMHIETSNVDLKKCSKKNKKKEN